VFLFFSNNYKFLIFQVDWQYKGSTYWVRFIHVELLGFPPSIPGPPTIKVGDKVRVKPTVMVPKYKWGSVNHKSIGVVTSKCIHMRDNWVGSFKLHQII